MKKKPLRIKLAESHLEQVVLEIQELLEEIKEEIEELVEEVSVPKVTKLEFQVEKKQPRTNQLKEKVQIIFHKNPQL